MRSRKKIAAVPDGGPDGGVTAAPSEPAVAPQTATEQDPRSPAQARLGALLNRQAELAADPAVRDDEYRAVVEQIVAAQAEVDLERARA